MKSSIYPLVFAVILGVTCATVLTATSVLLAPRRELNEQSERVRNILDVLGVPVEAGADSQQLLEVFARSVQTDRLGDLTLYRYAVDGQEQAVAVAFAGSGMWGPIEGFLALDPQMEFIRGVAFHRQEETPGLGGDISSPAWRQGFVGKSIRDLAGQPGIRIRRAGAALAENEVHAITSATMTCDKVESMLNGVIRRLIEERNRHGR